MNQDLPLKRDPIVSFMGIAVYLMGTYKTILIFGVFGLIVGIGLFWSTPKKYEAGAQISMAQIALENQGGFYGFGANVEEPALVILVLSSPMTFDLKTINECGLEGNPEAGVILSKSIKLATVKGADNLLILKTFSTSREGALNCANAVFQLIKARQDKIFITFIEQLKSRVVQNEERLKNLKVSMLEISKLGSLTGVAYLTARDEIRSLSSEINNLKIMVTNYEYRNTRLISPVYVSNTPIAPKKHIYLPAGLFGGLILGLLYALGRLMIAEIKAQPQGIDS